MLNPKRKVSKENSASPDRFEKMEILIVKVADCCIWRLMRGLETDEEMRGEGQVRGAA